MNKKRAFICLFILMLVFLTFFLFTLDKKLILLEIVFIFLLLKNNTSIKSENSNKNEHFEGKENIKQTKVTIIEEKNKSNLLQNEKNSYKDKISFLPTEDNNKEKENLKKKDIFNNNSYVTKPNDKPKLDSSIKPEKPLINNIKDNADINSKTDINNRPKVTVVDTASNNFDVSNKKNTVNNKTTIKNIGNLKVSNKIINSKNEFKLKNLHNSNKTYDISNKTSTPNKSSKPFSFAENAFCASIGKIIFDNTNAETLYFKKDKRNNINLDSTNISLNVSNNKKYLILPKSDAYKHSNDKTKFFKSGKDKVKVLVKDNDDLNSFTDYIVSEGKKSKNMMNNSIKNEFNIFNRTKVFNILNKEKKKKISNRVGIICKFYLRIANMYHRSESYDKEIEILSKGMKKLKDKNVDISIFSNKLELAKELLERQKERELNNKEKRKILQNKQ